ncbi:MAG: class I SAM-dependent methyltransferase [Deltaproteobacteria bacterium]|nr:class I SAM-dependent methyltransferase [Deltaproteobacteria bacterium]
MTKKLLTIENVSSVLKAHYSATFKHFGATAAGVDWGPQSEVELRYDRMLALVSSTMNKSSECPAVLDVGCGFGGLIGYAEGRGFNLRYTGIDLCDNMIQHARKSFPRHEFICGDIFHLPENRTFDFLLCNGVLTQKLNVSTADMDRYAERLIKKMFSHCTVGIAFNVMSTKVNFMVDNLYYRDPCELAAWCMREVTSRFVLDHGYPLFEYTLRLYRVM